MREIFFRGQTRRKGQKVWMDGSPVESNWVYGGICHGTGDFSIIYGNLDEERERPTEKWVVYTDTVGQFTGRKDKNGKKIFEGDVCRFYGTDGYADYVVFWDDTASQWTVRQIDLGAKDVLDSYFAECCEIIGNIHDNPELLGGAGGG